MILFDIMRKSYLESYIGKEKHMGQNVFEKIIASHLVSGVMKPGQEVGIRIDQTLTQDSLGAMAYLEFEAIGKEKVHTELSVSYVDHLMMQSGEGNADVHAYLETIAGKIGAKFSRPGNGICHQVHLERFSHPGKTLIGGDSHTVTCGAAGMAAFGVGGMDVALAMAGKPFYFTYPHVVHIVLEGSLRPWVTAKDIVLAVLKRMSVKGNVGKVIEYGGSALSSLSVPQRATITNMGAETGVTTSIFPSDDMTMQFLRMQGRESEWLEILPDADAHYDEEIVIDLERLEPLVALPHSPDRVTTVAQAGSIPVQQVLIGSCTNSSYQDMMKVAHILKGRKIAPHVSLGIAPGSRQVMDALASSGALAWMVEAGARILESGCGFCVGHGQAPRLGGVSVRTNNRNYKGRSGTQDAQVYLVSPETAAATAIFGCLTDPRKLDMDAPAVQMPEKMSIDDSMILPSEEPEKIYRSRIIGQPPVNTPMPEKFDGRVVIRVGDNINTDDIMPAGPTMVYRANIQKSCEYVFHFIDEHFPDKCKTAMKEKRIPIIVSGEAYGQGSSREHAALCPMAMGVRCVMAKSIERIHQANLANFGILPLIFKDKTDFDTISEGDELVIENIRQSLNQDSVMVRNQTKGLCYTMLNSANERQRKMIAAGGSLNMLD